MKSKEQERLEDLKLVFKMYEKKGRTDRISLLGKIIEEQETKIKKKDGEDNK